MSGHDVRGSERRGAYAGGGTMPATQEANPSLSAKQIKDLAKPQLSPFSFQFQFGNVFGNSILLLPPVMLIFLNGIFYFVPALVPPKFKNLSNFVNPLWLFFFRAPPKNILFDKIMISGIF
jgi:hypothetical protein